MSALARFFVSVGDEDKFDNGVKRTLNALIYIGAGALVVGAVAYSVRDVGDATEADGQTAAPPESEIPEQQSEAATASSVAESSPKSEVPAFCPSRAAFMAARQDSVLFVFEELPADGSEVILQVVREPTEPNDQGSFTNFVTTICRAPKGDLFYVSWEQDAHENGVVATAEETVDGFTATFIFELPVTYTLDLRGGMATTNPAIAYVLLDKQLDACVEPDATAAFWSQLDAVRCTPDAIADFDYS